MKNHKKIAMVSVHSDPLATMGSHEAGGQNVYVNELSRALSRLGWEVDIFTRADRKRKKIVVSINKRVRVIRLRAGPMRYVPKSKLLPHLPEFIGNLLSWQKTNNATYNLLHGHYWDGGWVVSRLKNILQVPAVETFHSLGIIRYNILKNFEPQSIHSEEFKNRITTEKEIIKFSDRIIAESPYEKEDLTKSYNVNPSKIKIIPAGVDPKKFKPLDKKICRQMLKLDEDAVIILYIGRLEWRKGIGTLISAFAKLLKMNPTSDDDIRLMIVGGSIGKRGNANDKKEYKRLKEVAIQKGVEKQVSFIGQISQDKVKYYYNSANICVVPSYYEPFGIVPLESMASGIPTIASSVGGLQYSVKDNKTGLQAPPRASNILAEKINMLLANPILAEKIIANAKVRVKEKFTWPTVAKEFSDLYASLIHNNNEKKT